MPFNRTLVSAGVLAIFASLIAGALWFANLRSNNLPVAPPKTAPLSATTNITATHPSPPIESADKLQDACAWLKTSTNANASRLYLAQLRARLSAMPPQAAVALIRSFLEAKADASTHLGFKLASNGLLNDAPTLRTFLLDELGRIDPAAAAEYSRTILAGMDSPDEWAVALRNLANGDNSPEARSLLQQKISQLLQYSPWQQNPSVGYLESFDVAVYLGGTDLIPTLSQLVRQQDNPAIAHASFLTLDRLVINNPAALLTTLEADPTLMQGRESTRADYFARADVRDPQQRQVLENYLLNPAITASELNAFAGIYPNGNFMISPNLLTQNATLDHDALVSRDEQALAVAQQWQSDPRFAKLQPVLPKILQRLQQFAQQAGPQNP